MKLSSFTKVKNEVQDFEICISKITNIKKRREYEILLYEFKQHLKIIDDNHSIEYNGYIQPGLIRSNIEEMSKIRHKFIQLKKDIG